MSTSVAVCDDLLPTSSVIPSLTALSGYSLRLHCSTDINTHSHTQRRQPKLKKASAFCSVYSGLI